MKPSAKTACVKKDRPMHKPQPAPPAPSGDFDMDRAYRLDDQVGFILRKANQRHTAIFSELIGDDLTPTQFATLAKLHELGECSQNRLGRLVAMDAASIKGVVDRMVKRGFLRAAADCNDRRRLTLMLTPEGRAFTERVLRRAAAITRETLKPLSAAEISQFVRLLSKLA
jgi:DNA-binding MarR family transcriptional regulator